MFNFYKYWYNLILENKQFKSAHVVIFRKDGNVLIMRRSESDEWMPGHYGLPGGKLDSGESPRQALSRECKEEASLSIKPENFIFIPKVSSQTEHSFYYVNDFSGEPKLDHEHDDYQWVNPKDLSKYKIVPDLIDIVNAALEDKK